MKSYLRRLRPFCYLALISIGGSMLAANTSANESTTAAPPPALKPHESITTISVPEGFQVELVASEPLVNDPVAIAWDEDGRLWVVEMWNYGGNSNVQTPKRPNRGRIVVLQDTDNDGRMDRSNVFLDKLSMPRAITFTKGGVLVADPPNLYFCEDTNDDLRCDVKTEVGTYAKNGGVEDSENGLVHGLDNWIYSAKSGRKLQWNGERITFKRTHYRGQWGLSLDDYGRFYYNTYSQWLQNDLFPYDETNRNPGFRSKSGVDRNLSKQAPSIPISACSPTIYRGDSFPEEYKGDAFVCTPDNHSVSRIQLKNDPQSIFSNATAPVGFLNSTDPRFRPISTDIGPDGNLYVIDMYRPKLNFKRWFLSDQTSPEGPPQGLGRIYRISPLVKTSSHPSVPQMGKMDTADIVAYLDHPNGWWRDTAQRLIIERKSYTKATLQALNQLLSKGSELGKIHALWTFKALDLVDNRTFQKSQNDASPWVRIHGLRTSEKSIRNASAQEFEFLDSARTHENEPLRLQAIQSLFHLKDKSYVTAAVLEIRAADLEKPYFQDSIVSSLSGTEIPYIQALDKITSDPSPAHKVIVENVATAIANKRNVENIQKLDFDTAKAWTNEAIATSLKKFLAQKGSDSEANVEETDHTIEELIQKTVDKISKEKAEKKEQNAS